MKVLHKFVTYLMVHIVTQLVVKHVKHYHLEQRFSTWSTRTPGGTPSTHRGYASSWQADCKVFLSSQYILIIVFKLIKNKKMPFLILISFTGGAICVIRGTILMWGVRKWVQSWCGGTQRGTSLIWGYASTKRLRTADLE